MRNNLLIRVQGRTGLPRRYRDSQLYVLRNSLTASERARKSNYNRRDAEAQRSSRFTPKGRFAGQHKRSVARGRTIHRKRHGEDPPSRHDS